MKDTQRDLPRALHSSMTIVLLLFVGANVSYFIVLDPRVVASTNTVALDFGRVTLGKFGALVFSCLVSISCFGALSASFYTCEWAAGLTCVMPLNASCKAHLCLGEGSVITGNAGPTAPSPQDTRQRNVPPGQHDHILHHLRGRFPG